MALIAAPDQRTDRGRRDRTLLLFLGRTGARVSEALGVKMSAISSSTEPGPRCFCTARAARDVSLPVSADLAGALRALIAELGLDRDPLGPIFRGAHDERMTRFGATHVVRRAVAKATAAQPGLARKVVSPHVLRHYLPRPTMSSSSDCDGKSLRNKEISRRSTRATRHSQRDLQAVQELQQIVVGPEWDDLPEYGDVFANAASFIANVASR